MEAARRRHVDHKRRGDLERARRASTAVCAAAAAVATLSGAAVCGRGAGIITMAAMASTRTATRALRGLRAGHGTKSPAVPLAVAVRSPVRRIAATARGCHSLSAATTPRGAGLTRSLACRIDTVDWRRRCLSTESSPLRAAPAANPKAAGLIIGDEILTGKVQDVNGAVMARFFFERGIDLVRIEVCTDEIEDIATSVTRLREAVGPAGYVLTSGGIGPTHDDRTYEAVAHAFGTTLELHEPTLSAMAESLAVRGQTVNEARRRMALLPAGCRTLSTPHLWVPISVMDNVYVLPGIPRLFEKMLHANAHHFVGGTARARLVIETAHAEGDFAAVLGEVAADHPALAIGSYPQTQSNRALRKRGVFRSRITLEGADDGEVRAAAERVREAVEGRYVAALVDEHDADGGGAGQLEVGGP